MSFITLYFLPKFRHLLELHALVLCGLKLTINVVRPNSTSEGHALPVMLNIYGYVLSMRYLKGAHPMMAGVA